MTILITGGCGFLGSNLAYSCIKKNIACVVFDNLSRLGSSENLAWLNKNGKVTFIHGDVRNAEELDRVVMQYRPKAIFHLAGQVAMTTSISSPRIDFEINALGSLNVLEAVRRHVPECSVVYSSTNKVYGDLEWVQYTETDTRYIAPAYPDGFSENISLDFHSPYGCSKGCADQYMLDYHRIYGLKTVVFRHSSMYGSRQFATFDQGWIGWFCSQALSRKQQKNNMVITISGNGKQVRDLLYMDDMISLYFQVIKFMDKTKGQAFNIGGGIENSLSLIELFDLLEKELGLHLKIQKNTVRISDQKVFVADISKINKLTGWTPKVGKIKGLKKMLQWVGSTHIGGSSD
ncbi:MAG: GDP-mannose 4,6-dehydratase [Verrucomicrobia bacterium]|nr:GDP-mannose 4,6-dehydratase [Verrucomicrobiota bacterium]